jgi:hypothetical protein
MSYAVLMAYVDADGIPEQRVRLAASLADKFNATLIGLSALGPPLLGKGVVFQEVTESDIKEMRALLAAKGNWFRSVRALITVGSSGDRYWTYRLTRWRARRGVPISS